MQLKCRKTCLSKTALNTLGFIHRQRYFNISCTDRDMEWVYFCTCCFQSWIKLSTLGSWDLNQLSVFVFQCIGLSSQFPWMENSTGKIGFPTSSILQEMQKNQYNIVVLTSSTFFFWLFQFGSMSYLIDVRLVSDDESRPFITSCTEAGWTLLASF